MAEGLYAREIKAIDAFTIEDIGIPSMVLMERAALAASEFVLENTKEETLYIFADLETTGETV